MVTPAAEAPAPLSAPSEEAITEGAEKSSVEHNGHGDDDAGTGAKVTAAAPAAPETKAEGNTPEVNTASKDEVLAETGGSSSSTYLAIGGAGVLAAGAAVLFASQRRMGRRRDGAPQPLTAAPLSVPLPRPSGTSGAAGHDGPGPAVRTSDAGPRPVVVRVSR